MNVASKKRGLFSRGLKTGTNNASSTSINDHHEENGKLKNAQSSPSGTSHHMNELDEDRFNGDGVVFQGKLIGHEYVAEARGEQMCQQSLKKLKIIQKALGGHKRKVNMYISFDGIKIMDINTNEELFHHTVPQISFISRDETDTRAFGYVFGNSQTGHQFIGIKSKKEAMVVMSTIGQLFAITLKRKRSAEEAAAAAAVVTTSHSTGEEHLYHSVQDHQQEIDLSSFGSNKTRARIRHHTGASLENVPIPALPPPSEQHPRHRQHGQQQTNNRFATIGRINDINNNNFQKQSSLINELDLFQPTITTGQNLGISLDSSLPKDQKPNHRLVSSYDWAHFEDDHHTHDDSTLNTISSISDTLTGANNTMTMNESVTLVSSNVMKFPSSQANQTNINNISINNKSAKLNSSSTTISSANFDGMDPFSDAFGTDEPFPVSTTVEISSNVFGNKIQAQNRPSSNPISNTMLDCKSNYKNSEFDSGSEMVPALTSSLGSLTLDKQQQTNNTFNTIKNKQPKQELPRNQNSADKYAVLHDINSISTSIFDSLSGTKSEMVSGNEDSKNLTSNISQSNQQLQPDYSSYKSSNNHHADTLISSKAPTSFCNDSYQHQQQQNPNLYGVNGVVILPPVTYSASTQQPVINYNTTEYAVVMSNSDQSSSTKKSTHQWLTKSFDETSRNFANRQPPRAEFDSMSNLSSTSSNASSSNNQIIRQGGTPKKSNEKQLENSIPLFQELDPLKNKSYSPSNYINENRNRSPLPNPLDSSLSSMNSSNSSLFNSRNCSTPSSLHRKSPQLLNQHSLPINTSKIPTSDQNNSPPLTLSESSKFSNQIKSSSIVMMITTTTTTTINSNPHYIMLCNFNSSNPINNKDHLNENQIKSEVDTCQNMNETSETQEISSKDDIEESNNQQEKEPSLLSTTEIDNNTINKHSQESSISSSSNSLLINHSNLSESKFDDVFEMPLLEDTNTNTNNEIKLLDDSSQKQSVSLKEEKSEPSDSIQLKSNESISFAKSEVTLNKYSIKNQSANSGTTRSLSRQSSTSSSTPPAIPPRTDLQHSKYTNHPIPPPPLPPPHSNFHHSPYHMPYRHPHAHQQYQPPLYYPSYYSSPDSYGHQDPYADPITLRRPTSHHHRYWNSSYDWYGSNENQIYGPTLSNRSLDYPAAMSSPPISISNIPTAYGEYSGSSVDYYAHQQNSRPFSGNGDIMNWHDYYLQSSNNPHLMVPPSPGTHTLITHPQQKQQPAPSSTLSGDYTNQPLGQQDKSICTKSSSQSSTPPPIGDESCLDDTPPLPKPQRRVSSSSSGGAVVVNQSTSSTSSTFSIPTYPPPPPPQDPPFYYSYDDANKSAQFATFNMNMEQMIMKYHHQPLHRNSPILPPYEYVAGPYQYQYQTATRGRNYSNQLDHVVHQPSSMVPSYRCNNSIGSNSSGSSGYSSNINHMIPMVNNGIRMPPSTWLINKQIQDTPPQQQPELLWDNNSESKLDSKNLLFEDNFANFVDLNDDNQLGFDTVKRVVQQKDSDEKKTSNENNEKEQSIKEPNILEISKDAENSEESLNQKDSPEERNIFASKDDPFEDDFFKS